MSAYLGLDPGLSGGIALVNGQQAETWTLQSMTECLVRTQEALL